MSSDLAGDYLLVAMDLRGHGLSDRPRSLDNDDLLPKIRKPVLIRHGADDAIVKPAVVDQHKVGMAHAQIHIMMNAGHAPFWDHATTLNRRLRAFAEGL